VADVLVLAGDLSTPIKVAWILWLAWGLAQIGWYRRACTAVPVSQPTPHPRLERDRVEPRRARSGSPSTPTPSAPGDVMAAAADSTPPSNDAAPSESTPEKVVPPVTDPPHES
jgi:hypothetical protein